MADPPRPNGPDEDRGPIITSTMYAFSGIAIVSQLARLYCRLKFRTLGWDDYWMFFTTANLLAFAISVHICMLHGGGRHLYYLVQENPANYVTVERLNWIAQPFSIAALGYGKMSVGLLIIRYLYTGRKAMRLGILIYIISVNVFLHIAIFLTFFQCNPPRKLWDPSVPGSCWDPYIQARYSVFAAGYSAVADIVLALIPSEVIWRLQMPRKRRVGLCAIFSVGIVAGAIGLLKTSKILGLGAHSDITWQSYKAFLYTSAEIFLVILGGTLPTIKPLYYEVLTRVSTLRTSFGRSHPNNTPSQADLTNRSLSSAEKFSRNESSIQTEIVPIGRRPSESDGTLQLGEIHVRHSVDIEVSLDQGGQLSERPWEFNFGNTRGSA